MQFLKPVLFVFAVFTWFIAIPGSVYGQQNKPPFWNEIQEFKKQDSMQPPPSKAILFVGSSSFRMWNDLEETFKTYGAINRGFGGSTLKDAIFYADQIILPYNPRQIVIYAGENDIAGNISARQTLKRFVTLFEAIRLKLPLVPVAFVSIKPSPSRQKFMPVIKECNQLIKTYLQKHKYTQFIDVFSPMLNEQGKPKPEIFLQDSLHMNANGYQIWRKEITPVLIKN